MEAPAWIAADWGTSRLRVAAMAADGRALAEAESAAGMGGLARDGFEPALLALVGGWLPPGRRTLVLICGMAGARQGWIEAPYAEVGTPLAALARQAVRAPAADPRLDARILPGVLQRHEPDVMRGEETQLLGLVAEDPDFDGRVCLPGTHSKWARLADGAVQSFHTYLTGELFAALAGHTVLRHSLAAEGRDEGRDDGAFAGGVADAMDRPAALSRRLFGLRARDLVEGAAPAAARARLSGLLIGLELADALGAGTGPIRLVAAGGLAERYAAALRLAGAPFETADAARLTRAGLIAARNALEEA